MRTIKGHSLLEYQAPEEWQSKDGIVLPSAATMRDYLRGKDPTFSVDDPVPDIYRYGKLVSGALNVPDGYLVYFNRHDAEHFEYEGKEYYRINDNNALAYVDPEVFRQ